MEHVELIEGAFVDYLFFAKNGAGASVWPPGFDVARIFPGQNNLDKDGQRIVAYVDGDLGEEDPPNSGNRWADVIVQLRTPFSKLTAEQKAKGSQEPLDLHKAVASALQVAIAGDGTATGIDDVKLTSAIDGFTCFGFSNRSPFREQEDNAWVSGWKLRMISCPSAFPN